MRIVHRTLAWGLVVASAGCGEVPFCHCSQQDADGGCAPGADGSSDSDAAAPPDASTSDAELADTGLPDGGPVRADAAPPLPDAGTFDSGPCSWSAFSAPTPLSELNSRNVDWTPSISADGLTLFFSSDRPSGVGTFYLWMASRASTATPFGTPVFVPGDVDSSGAEDNPSISSDGLELYFDRRDGHLYAATRASPADPFGAPVALPGLQGSAPSISYDGLSLYYDQSNEVAVAVRPDRASPFVFQRVLSELTASGGLFPSISADGLELYLEVAGSSDTTVFVARRPRAGDPFGAPAPVFSPADIPASGDPSISSDGRTLYFAGESPKGSPPDLYFSTRTCQ